MTPAPDRLYVVTRADLDEGQRAVQAAHAAIELCLRHGPALAGWHAQSSHLVILLARDERHLVTLWQRAEVRGLVVATFREPDRANEVTAIAIEPGPEATRACRDLPMLGTVSAP